MAGELDVLDDVADGVVDDTPLRDDDPAARAQQVDLLPPSKLPESAQFQVLRNWHTADADFSREWRGQAKFWFGFRAGEQWTVDDKAVLDEKSRPHIVFNRVLTILKAVAGMEINGRHETAFLPRGTEDAKANEVLSQASSWMGDECDAEDEESQAFEDTATCGMGWVEQRMSYEDDAAGLYIEDKINPLEMYWDRTSRKKNLSDSRRRSRVRRMPLSDAVSMFPGKTRDQIDAGWAMDSALDFPQKSIEQKWKRDEDNSLDPSYNDLAEVTVVQIQWFEKEVYWIVADEATNTKAELSDAQYRQLEERAKLIGMEFESVRLTRKVFKQAFLGAEGVMLKKAHAAPIAGQFSWKCVTGELDQVTGTWFGLVKPMVDPQMWANKWLSQVLHILNTTAKGGILAETSAFDDQREAEDTYGQPDEITWLADGALSGDKPKLIPKPGEGKVDAYVGLMQFAVEAIHQVAGINLELIGQRDINQPGVLEMMRKQAGMTVLATLFDSLRRFRKQIGRGRLYFIQNFLSDGRLIRITGPEGAQAIQLAKDKTVGTYDVVVDDAPTSPNQKQENWQIIQPMLAAFKDQLIANPMVFVLLLEYSPLPTRVVDAIKQLIQQQMNDPETQKIKAEDRQLLVQSMLAKINKDQSAAEMQNAKAGSSQAVALYDIAMAHNMMEDNLRQGKWEEAKNAIETIKAAAENARAQNDTVRTRADAVHKLASADHTRARADRERAGVMVDVESARGAHETDRASGHREMVGAMIDGLTGQAKARRDHAAAEKDLAVARREDRTPVKPPAKASA